MSIQAIENLSIRKNVPDIRPGMTVKVYQKIKEGGKERVQIFEGLVIARKGGRGVSAMFTVRKVVDGIGVEKTFPLHSPNVTKIELVKQAKVRRSKLYYMRERTGKAMRLKSTMLEGRIFVPGAEVDDAPVSSTQEEPVTLEVASEPVVQEVQEAPAATEVTELSADPVASESAKEAAESPAEKTSKKE